MNHAEETVRPYELRAQNAKVLLRRLYRELAALIMEEAGLAKAAASERACTAAVALRGFVCSFVCAVLGLASVSACAIVGIAVVAPLWLAALVVGAVYIVAALAFGSWARRRFVKFTEPLVSPEHRSRLELARRQIDETIAALERKTDLLPPLRDTALGLGSLGVAVAAIVREGR